MRIRLRCALEELLGRTLKAQPLIAFQHTSHEMKRYDRGVSPQGNANCEAGSKAGMSYEFMHRAHRASTEGRKMGGSVGVWGTPVVYRGGWPVDCASCLYALIPYPR